MREDELVHRPHACSQLSFQKAQSTRASTFGGPQKFSISLTNTDLHFQVSVAKRKGAKRLSLDFC